MEIDAVGLTKEQRVLVVAYLQAAHAPAAMLDLFTPKDSTPLREQAMRLIDAAMTDEDLSDYTRGGFGALVLLTDEQLAGFLYNIAGDTADAKPTDLQQAVSDALQVIDDPEDR
jgi:hypothetical protein